MFPTEQGVGGLICVAKIRESGRRRFTIAHEIGHYMLLDKSVAPSVCSLKGRWEMAP
jgi:Zn-dependent peptidase ImmA (M78 family)